MVDENGIDIPFFVERKRFIGMHKWIKDALPRRPSVSKFISLSDFQPLSLWSPTCETQQRNGVVNFAIKKRSKGRKMSRESLRFLSEREITRIQQLLAATELSFQNIADRMDCAKSTIIAINRKYSIRSYGGRRSQWQVVTSQFSGANS